MNNNPGEQRLRQALRRLRPHTAPPPTGLPGELCDRLELTLLTCAPINATELRALFVDNRVSQWKGDIPITQSPVTRARTIIETLFSQENTLHENALILLLYVLRDRTDINNSCYRRLSLLAQDIERVIKAQR